MPAVKLEAGGCDLYPAVPVCVQIASKFPMVIFVHLTPERNVGTILRQGITRMRGQDDHPAGIFAMPAARSFHVSHQWLNELKDRGHLRVAAMYFRVPESEPVWVGHYRERHEQITAKKAMEWFVREMRSQGFEVIVPRRISPDQIYRIHHLARVLPLERFPILNGNKGTSSANGHSAA